FPRADGSTPGRKLIEDAGIEIAVKGKGQSARNGCGRHHQRVRFCFSFLHQAEALHYTEPMLLIHNHQSELVEFHFLLDQSVCSDYEMRVALAHMAASVAPGLFVL